MATMEELERRLEFLEEQVRHTLPAKVDAVAYGLSLVHTDTQAIRQAQERHGEMLAHHGELLEHQGEQLAEILRRLPPAP